MSLARSLAVLAAVLLAAGCTSGRAPAGTTGAPPRASTGATTGGSTASSAGSTSGASASSASGSTGPASSSGTATGGMTTASGSSGTGSVATASGSSSTGASSASSSSAASTATSAASTVSSSSGTSASATTGGLGTTTGAQGTTTGGAPGADTPPAVPLPQAAQLAASPTAPTTEAGQALPWPSAPQLTPVQVELNRDSVILDLPAVPGAQDYRAFRVPAGSSLSVNAGAEQVLGTTLYCAGMRQRSGPAPASPAPLQQIEVADLSGPTTLVIEALDAPCPFPGVRGATHVELPVSNPEIEAAAQGTLSFYTEAEQRQSYGSLIVNGHGWGSTAGQPAPNSAPRVLARTTVVVSPLGNGPAPLAFFDDFSGTDQPALVGPVDNAGRSQQGKLFQNQRWDFYSYGAGATQFFIDHGALHTLLADWEQDIFSSNIAYPRRPVALSSTDYLHVTYEVPTDATARRYWEIFLCGAETAGATFTSSGALNGRIIESPFFYQPDGQDPSVEGWNCLLVFPRGGWPFPLGPSNTNPESNVQVVINRANQPDRASVVDVSPDQYHDPNTAPPSWYRQMWANGTLIGPMLDDQMRISPRTRYDLYIRRDRVVMFVNGEQRLCNDFPAHALTMAEGALGFGQVLYHSAAERQEFFVNYWDRTGQLYYIHDTPFADVRDWDNLGYQEHVPAPPQFDPGGCYVAP